MKPNPKHIRPDEITPKETVVIECAPAQDGSFSCAVPAGNFEVKLRAPGFASYFFSFVAIAPMSTTDFGAIVLRPGASIIGRVETLDGSPLPDNSSVVLSVFKSVDVKRYPEPGPDQWSRFAVSRPDATGFFEFEGLPTATFRVVASSDGFVDAVSHLFELSDGTEATLRESLLLARPATITIEVNPPKDLRDMPWQVQIHPSDPRARFSEYPEVPPATTGEGRAVFPGLAPGSFAVTVFDSLNHIWAATSIDLVSGEQSASIDLDIVHVDGRIEMGNRPIQTGVTFHQLGDVRLLKTSSNEDGDFSISLPAPGHWEVTLRMIDGRSLEVQGGIEIERPKDDDRVEVSIDLPDTLIDGRVVDRDGKGVAGAEVECRPLTSAKNDPLHEQRVISSSDGGFALRGIPFGMNIVVARDPRTGDLAESRLVEVIENVSTSFQTLVLMPKNVLRGDMLGSSGPIAQASIVFVPVLSQAAILSFPQAITQMDGTFELMVPEKTDLGILLGFPSGHAAVITEVAPKEDERVILMPDTVGGTVTIRWDSTLAVEGRVRKPILFVHGIPTPLVLYAQWARAHNAGIWTADVAAIPAMPAGVYKACFKGPKGSSQKCVSAELTPLSEIILDLQN
jgi:hypothetical protein